MRPTLEQSGSRGQMTIEFALLFPVMLMIALIAVSYTHLIQHRTGSSLSQVLEVVRQSVDDQLELKRLLQTQTAQAKLSAQIVTIMPFLIIGVFSLISEGFLEPFFTSAVGIILLAIAIAMQAGGILLVRKMLKVEVT